MDKWTEWRIGQRNHTLTVDGKLTKGGHFFRRWTEIKNCANSSSRKQKSPTESIGIFDYGAAHLRSMRHGIPSVTAPRDSLGNGATGFPR